LASAGRPPLGWWAFGITCFAASERSEQPMNERERQRKRALMVFQIFIYGYLLLMFGIQLSMWATRNW
jgi:predicted nucleic acid-binding Zn ribbon protein